MADIASEELAIRLQLNDRGIHDEVRIQNEISRRTGRLNGDQLSKFKNFVHASTLSIPSSIINVSEDERMRRAYNNYITDETAHGRRTDFANNLFRYLFSGGQLNADFLAGLQDVPNVLTEKTFKDIEEDKFINIKKKLSGKDLDNMETECSICLCDFEEDDKVKRLKCGHMFHLDCAEEWLTKHNYTCSVCNTEAGEHVAKT